MSRLTVYSREDCPLCEELLAELLPWAAERGFAVQIIDVDSDPQLVRRYGLNVPLVDWSGETVCFGHLDLLALKTITRSA